MLKFDILMSSKFPIMKRLSILDPSLPIWFIHGQNSWIQKSSSLKIAKQRPNYTFIKVIYQGLVVI
jgi:hypothetical protein